MAESDLSREALTRIIAERHVNRVGGVLQALRESGGGAITVSEEGILSDMRAVASLEGMFVCPEGAALSAALRKLLKADAISADDSILLLNTGSGLKYLDMIREREL